MYELNPLKQVHLSRLSPVMWRFGGTYPRKNQMAMPIHKANGMGSVDAAYITGSLWTDIALYGAAGAALYFVAGSVFNRNSSELYSNPSDFGIKSPERDEFIKKQLKNRTGADPSQEMFDEVERRLGLAKIRRGQEPIRREYAHAVIRSVVVDSFRKQESSKRQQQTKLTEKAAKLAREKELVALHRLLKDRTVQVLSNCDLTEAQGRAVIAAVVHMASGGFSQSVEQLSDLEYQDRRRGLILLVGGKKNTPALPSDHPLRLWIQQRKGAWGE
jgi:hypothetical protein